VSAGTTAVINGSAGVRKHACVATQNVLGGIKLQTIDPETGRVNQNLDVPSGIASPTDMASDIAAGNNKIWVVTADFDNSLIEIDVTRAAIASRVSLPPQRAINTLAIDPSDGSFYGTTTNELVRINRETGAISQVGVINHLSYRGLTFDREGKLYGIGNFGTTLIAIDKLTAQTEQLFTLPKIFDDIAVRPEDGQMFGIDADAIIPQLYRIDITNRLLTSIGRISVRRPAGLAFITIPEPPSLAISVFALLVMCWRRNASTRNDSTFVTSS
jgi:hypothetical protein